MHCRGLEKRHYSRSSSWNATGNGLTNAASLYHSATHSLSHCASLTLHYAPTHTAPLTASVPHPLRTIPSHTAPHTALRPTHSALSRPHTAPLTALCPTHSALSRPHTLPHILPLYRALSLSVRFSSSTMLRTCIVVRTLV